MWALPILLLAVTIALSILLSRYFAWIMDGRFHPLAHPIDEQKLRARVELKRLAG